MLTNLSHGSIIPSMDSNETTYETPDGRIACTECDRWIHKGSDKQIVHSSRCDSKAQQSAPVETVERFAGRYSQEAPGSGLSTDELRSDFQRGYITMSDAMNTDF